MTRKDEKKKNRSSNRDEELFGRHLFQTPVFPADTDSDIIIFLNLSSMGHKSIEAKMRRDGVRAPASLLHGEMNYFLV